MKKLSYAQMYYAKKKAKELGISVSEYLSNKKGKKQSVSSAKKLNMSDIDFSSVRKLIDYKIDSKMLMTYKSGLEVDALFSFDKGIPVGTNIMITGDPGIGKTTIGLHTLSHLQNKNPDLKCLFICAEMSKVQMYKYMMRFPVFGCLDTFFPMDFSEYNTAQVVEQLLEGGYDYVLIDSLAELIGSLKAESKMSITEIERWLLDLFIKHNGAANKSGKYTTFMLIQQVTKDGTFVGSNKIKHITDAHLEVKKGTTKEGDPDQTYIRFSKNRNGSTGIKYYFMIDTDNIRYSIPQIDSSLGITEEFSLSNGA
jgi:predicted ATP-dependent serine protease